MIWKEEWKRKIKEDNTMRTMQSKQGRQMSMKKRGENGKGKTG